MLTLNCYLLPNYLFNNYSLVCLAPYYQFLVFILATCPKSFLREYNPKLKEKKYKLTGKKKCLLLLTYCSLCTLHVCQNVLCPKQTNTLCNMKNNLGNLNETDNKTSKFGI